MKVLTFDEFNELYPNFAIDPDAHYQSNKEMITTIVEAVQKSGNEFVQVFEGLAEPVIIMK